MEATRKEKKEHIHNLRDGFEDQESEDKQKNISLKKELWAKYGMCIQTLNKHLKIG